MNPTEILSQVQYKDWTFIVNDDYLQVSFVSPCSLTGELIEQKGRKWRLSKFMTKSEIVSTALKAVLTAEEHEAREQFKYRSKTIFGPHFDVDKLADLCDTDSNDVRDNLRSIK